jgi:hypothetical protein
METNLRNALSRYPLRIIPHVKFHHPLISRILGITGHTSMLIQVRFTPSGDALGIVSAMTFSPDAASGMYAVGTFKGGRVSCYTAPDGVNRTWMSRRKRLEWEKDLRKHTFLSVFALARGAQL